MRSYMSQVFESIYALFMDLCETQKIIFHRQAKVVITLVILFKTKYFYQVLKSIFLLSLEQTEPILILQDYANNRC